MSNDSGSPQPVTARIEEKGKSVFKPTKGGQKPQLRQGLSNDWPNEYVNQSALQSSKEASYVDTFSRKDF